MANHFAKIHRDNRKAVKGHLLSRGTFMKTDGAICGGNKREANKILKQDGHCEKHKKLNKKCEGCLDKYIELTDIMFMALM